MQRCVSDIGIHPFTNTLGRFDIPILSYSGGAVRAPDACILAFRTGSIRESRSGIKDGKEARIISSQSHPDQTTQRETASIGNVSTYARDAISF